MDNLVDEGDDTLACKWIKQQFHYVSIQRYFPPKGGTFN
jgi:hypothetical protein